MADIEPRNTQLPDIKDRETSLNIQFSPILFPGERLISLTIKEHDNAPGVSVGTDTISGAYDFNLIYPLLPGCVNYFDTDTGELKTADNMSDVPPGHNVVRFATPGGYKTEWTYTVELIYSINNSSQPPLIKVYRQDVYNNLDIHQQALRNYCGASHQL